MKSVLHNTFRVLREGKGARSAVIALIPAIVHGLAALAWARSSGLLLSPDSASYLNAARSLIHDHAFAVHPGGMPQVVRTPGYPSFLAPLLVTVGDNAVVMSVVHATILTWLAAVPAIALAHRFGGRKSAWVTTALLTCEPVYLHSTAAILTEAANAACLAWLAWALASVFSDGRPRFGLAIASGVFCMAATFVRPTTYYLPAFLAVALMVATHKRLGFRTAMILTLCFSISAMAPVTAWQLRNELTTGSYRFSQIESINMLRYRAAGALAARDNVPLEVAQQSLSDSFEKSHSAPTTQSQIGAYYESQFAVGVEIVSANYKYLFVPTLLGAARMLIGPGGEFLRRTGMESELGSAPILMAWATLILILATYAATLLARNPALRGAATPLILIAAYVIAVSAGPEAYSRFREPLLPLLLVLAGHGAAVAATRFRAHSHIRKSQSPT